MKKPAKVEVINPKYLSQNGIVVKTGFEMDEIQQMVGKSDYPMPEIDALKRSFA